MHLWRNILIMAQTGFTPISLFYTTTASAVPTAGNLVNGELAINISTSDGKLFYKDSAGVVQVLATKGSATVGGSTTQVQYNNAGVLAGSANFVFDGTSVGIGAASPVAWGNPRLYVKQTSAAAYVGATVESSTNGNAIFIGHTGSVGTLGVSYGASGGYTPLTFETSGTERMRIDSSGLVTAPYQTGFKINKQANSQAIAANTWTRISFNNTTSTGCFNTGSAYSTSTNRFTAPVTGKYLFTVSVNILPTIAGQMYIDFGINGSNNVSMEAINVYTTSTMTLTSSTVVSLSANDTVEVDIFATTAVTAGDRTCGFSGQLLS